MGWQPVLAAYTNRASGGCLHRNGPLMVSLNRHVIGGGGGPLIGNEDCAGQFGHFTLQVRSPVKCYGKPLFVYTGQISKNNIVGTCGSRLGT